MTKTHKIDATDKTIGYVASACAKLLMGKTSPDYVANKTPDVYVTITNASKTKMSEQRKTSTTHERYSGYPGGFKKSTNSKIAETKGWKDIYELAIYGMLPTNKLRPKMMKHLTITE